MDLSSLGVMDFETSRSCCNARLSCSSTRGRVGAFCISACKRRTEVGVWDRAQQRIPVDSSGPERNTLRTVNV